MSEKNTEAKNATEETQLSEEGLESVSGGLINGGCIPTFPGTDPTFPPPIIDDYVR